MKEKLETKLDEIRAQKERVMADYHALSGAEQMLLQLIKELSENENDNG